MSQLSGVPPVTLAELGGARLWALSRVLGFSAAQMHSTLKLFEEFASTSWGQTPAHKPPMWPSDITDDHSPFEFSLAIDGGKPELRFLVEVQGAEPTLQSHWDAAREMNRLLEANHGAHLGRLSVVEDLFAPTAQTRRFALWHAVCLRPGSAPDFKIYLNPQSRGRAEAREVVVEAMTRLGFGEACAHLPATGAEDEICYFSLDLASRHGARVKVYTAHHDATTAHVERMVSSARGYVAGRATKFCEAMAGGRGPYRARPVLTCLSFVAGIATPTTGTVHFPVRCYAGDDLTVRDRVLDYIHPAGQSIYRCAIDAFAERPLEDGLGMQTYASLRLDRERDRLTVYLSPEVYEVGQGAMTQPARSMVARHKSKHPVAWLAASGEAND